MEEVLAMLKVMEDRRKEERKEDQERMEAVIKTELKDVVNVVRKEVEDAMQPWKDRTARVEESTAEIGEEVRRLAAEMRGMKEQVAMRQEERSYAGVVGCSGARLDGGRHGVAGGVQHGAAAAKATRRVYRHRPPRPVR